MRRPEGFPLSIARFCTRCGASNPSGLETCPSCGASLRLAPATPVPEPPPPATPLWATLPTPLKRATFGLILGDTFSVFAKDALTYVLVFLLYGALTTALSLLLQNLVFTALLTGAIGPGLTSSGYLLAFVAFTAVTSALNLVIGSIVTASLTHLAVHRYRGTPVAVGDAFAVGARRFVSVMGASLVQGLLLGALLAGGAAVVLYGAVTLNLGLVCGGGVLILVLLPVAVYLTVALSLYAPAIVIEGKTAIGGLRRSWELTRGRRLTLFLVLLVLGIILAAVGAAVTIPFAFVTNPFVSAIGGVIATGITGSWVLIMAAVAYQLIVTEPPWQQPALFMGPPGAYYGPPGPPKP